MPYKQLLQILSNQFIDAWNEKDIEQLMTHFTKYSILESKNVSILFPEKTENRLIGCDEILDYFSIVYKKNFPTLEREKLEKEGIYIVNHSPDIKTESKIRLEISFTEYGKIKTIKFIYTS